MELVFLTALGIGGATVVGALLGFIFKNISHKFSDIVLSFAAGVMLCAAIIGLILPSLEYGGGKDGLFMTIAGIFCGAFCLNLLDKVTPHLHRLAGVEHEAHPEQTKRINKVLLFVMAIGIHNLPEGIAAGVGFGTENVAQAMSIAVGIALQNIPEGMVIIAPMLAAGMSQWRTFWCAMATGLVEVLGTLLGYFAVTLSSTILPFALAFAGGTMMYVISDEMIPETHHGDEEWATYALLVGFCTMLVMSYYMEQGVKTSLKFSRKIFKKGVDILIPCLYNNHCSELLGTTRNAEVAELADALDSKSSGFTLVPVRVRPSAPANMRFIER